MTWTYNNASLDTSQAVGRLNSVRLLVGDTDSIDQQIQDEEIYFALSQATDNIYNAASFVCNLLAAKYSRLVTTSAEQGVSTNYSDLVSHYNTLSSQIDVLSRKNNGKSLGIYVGGVSITSVDSVNSDTDRVQPEFTIDKFDNGQADIIYPIGV